MRISNSSRSHQRAFEAERLDQPAWLRECAELGFDGVELCARHFPATDPDYLKRLKRTCTELYLTTPMVSADVCISPAGAGATDAIESITRWMDVACALGSPRIGFGCRGDAELAGEVDEATCRLVDTVRAIAAAGESRGIVTCLEHQGMTAGQVVRLLRDVDSPCMKPVLNVADLLPSQRRTAEGYRDIETCALHASIVRARFCDVDEDGSDNQLDWRRIRDVLSSAGFRGFLALEYTGDADEVATVRKIAPFLISLR